MTTGRPTKLDAKTHKAIVDAIRKGGWMKAAYKTAGIAKSTYQQWLAWGETEQTEDEDPAETARLAPYRRLVADIDKAEAEFESRAVAVVIKAAEQEGDWRAAMEILRRRFGGSGWGDKAQVEVSTAADQPAVLVIAPKVIPDVSTEPGGSE